MKQIIVTIISHRDLLWALIVRDIKVRYKQSILGAGWAILQPLLMMLIFTIIFSRFTTIPTDGIPYPIFSYCALLPWTFFASALTFAIPSIVNNAHLVTKVYVPRCLFPVAAICSCGVDFFISGVIFLGMLAYFQMAFSLKMFSILLVFIVQLILTTGIALLFSTINVHFRDVRYLIPLGLQIALFLSPVIYSINSVPEKYRQLYLLNPMAGIIECYRQVLLQGQTLPFTLFLPAAIISLFLFIVAALVFQHYEGRFADVI